MAVLRQPGSTRRFTHPILAGGTPLLPADAVTTVTTVTTPQEARKFYLRRLLWFDLLTVVPIGDLILWTLDVPDSKLSRDVTTLNGSELMQRGPRRVCSRARRFL